MPLQYRVAPNGDIFATSAKGTMLGNRGGKFHREDKTLGKRRWASTHWICCELEWKGAHHEPMGTGYTSLFFLDEVTALSAGHRPCFYCRRQDAKAFSEFKKSGPLTSNFTSKGWLARMMAFLRKVPWLKSREVPLRCAGKNCCGGHLKVMTPQSIYLRNPALKF